MTLPIRWRRICGVVLVMMTAQACSLVTPFGEFVVEVPDASTLDANTPDAAEDAAALDAGAPDGGTADAGRPDAQAGDAAALDASSADAPPVTPDAGDLDAPFALPDAVSDAYAPDAFTPPDAGTDAYVIDAAPLRHVITLENGPSDGGTIVATVGGSPAGICASARCDVLVDDGATLQLTATPSALHRLGGWSRAGCLAALPCTFVVSGPETVRASWIRRHTLTVTQSSGYPSGNVIAAWSPTTNTPLDGLVGCTTGTGCTFEVDPGTRVRLSVTRTPRWQGVVAWSVAGCAGPTCDVTVTRDETVTIETGPLGRLAFLTSTTFDGDLTGDPMPAAQEADAICQSVASSVGMPGTYRAWLSGIGAGESVAARFAGAQGPWIRPDGTPFVATLAELFTARFLNPLAVDETGARYATVPPWRWSNTRVDGSAFSTMATQTCNGFSSSSGLAATGLFGSSATSGGDRWTSHPSFNQPCANAASLGCFQIDTSASPRGFLPGPQVADEGTRIFLSSMSFTGSASRAAMDAQCVVDAAAAGLPGSYLALVGTSTAAPLSRFPRPFPWVRVDGWTVIQRIEETDAFAPAILRADGTRPTSLELRAWTGSGARLDATGSTCSDWTSAGSGVAGASGDVTGQFDWQGSAPPACNTSHPVYCVRAS